MKSLPKALAKELVEAALDQPGPTDALKLALNAALRATDHRLAPRITPAPRRRKTSLAEELMVTLDNSAGNTLGIAATTDTNYNVMGSKADNET